MGDSRRIGVIYPSPGHGPTRRNRRVYGHPSHRGFARAIRADDIVVRFRSLPAPLRDTFLTSALSSVLAPLPERDVYLLENDGVLFAAPSIRWRYPEATIVHLAASDRLLEPTFTPRPDETVPTGVIRWANAHIDTALLRRILTRWCDGAVAVSPFVRDRLRSIAGPQFPIRVATPYLTPDVFDSMATVEPDLSDAVAVTVGMWRNHKGIDMLVDAWSRVRERHPKAELRIIGQNHPARYAETPGVALRGIVDDLTVEFAAASLYVHPAYVEPFGVSVVEAMRAGLPAVVTSTTGAKCAVAPVHDSLVVRPESAALAEGICRYFDTPVERRRALSRASRRQSDSFTEERKTARFREEFLTLVDEVTR